jgi:hypothetical protein
MTLERDAKQQQNKTGLTKTQEMAKKKDLTFEVLEDEFFVFALFLQKGGEDVGEISHVHAHNVDHPLDFLSRHVGMLEQVLLDVDHGHRRKGFYPQPVHSRH